jgi:hypothetical protein
MGDASGSVRGFAAASSKQLKAIYRLVLRVAAEGQVRLCAMRHRGGQQDFIQPVAGNNVDPFGDPSFYAGDTPLADAVSRLTGDPANSTAIVITDGMESEGYAVRLRGTMESVVAHGWGAWLLMVRLSFDGLYFSEQHVGSAHLERLREAVRKVNAEWTVDPPRGHSDDKCVQAGTCFWFRGLRPLLILVLARDPANGRNLAMQVGSDLRREPLPEPKVLTVELAPLHERGIAVSHYSAAGEAGEGLVVQSGNSLQPVLECYAGQGPQTKKVVTAVRWEQAPLPFEQPCRERWLHAVEKKPGWVQAVTPSASFNTSAAPEQQGTIEVAFLAAKPGTLARWLGQAGEYDQPLVFKLSTQLELSSDARWWDQWSADTSWETPHLVFRLRELVRSTAQAALKRKNAQPKVVQMRVAFH